MKKRKFKIKTTFIDREQELRLLRNYLEAQPNSILFLYGPKSSGKTTLLYRLCDELAEDKSYDVKFLNLRETFLDSYDDFLQAFFKTRSDRENGLNVSTKRQYSMFGLFKLDAVVERMLKGKNEDPFVVMKAEFQKLVKKGRRPLIIIDEFHKLSGIYDPVDLLSSRKNLHNIKYAQGELTTISCVLIFKIGVNQQSHIST